MRLEDKLGNYSGSDFYPFHMPGHKRRLDPWKMGNPYGVDITEIEGFDNLNDAHGIILDEEQWAAKQYGTKESLFCVNGSTACLLAAVSAAVRRNGTILMARNCHKSVYHAVYLRGLEAEYLYPPLDSHQIGLGILPEQVEEALKRNASPEAVLITSPTYEGAVSDIRAIADIAHRYGKPLIVDEAHGAHFGMHPYFPQSAVQLGADVVIQSLHKTLPSMTQTAILHICSDRVCAQRIHRFLQIYQSSSPSYILMGSITACLHMVWEHGEELFDPYVSRLKACRERLERSGHFFLWSSPGADPSKLVLVPKKESTFMTGEELYHILLDRYHLQLEMALPNLALAMTSVGDSSEGFERLCRAIEEIDSMCPTAETEKYGEKQVPEKQAPAKTQVMRIWEAMEQDREEVSRQEAVGRISADFYMRYPPGVPEIVPGERITERAMSRLADERFWILKTALDG